MKTSTHISSSLIAISAILLMLTTRIQPTKAQIHVQAYISKVYSWEGHWYDVTSCWQSGTEHFFRQFQVTACYDSTSGSCTLQSDATKCEECVSSSSCTTTYSRETSPVLVDQTGMSTGASLLVQFSAYESQSLPKHYCNFGDWEIFDTRWCELSKNELVGSLTSSQPATWIEKGPIGNGDHKLWLQVMWDCDPGHFGQSCQECPGSGTCSGHGTCSDGFYGTGLCMCESGYTLFDCSSRSASATSSRSPSPSPSASTSHSSVPSQSKSASQSATPSSSLSASESLLPSPSKSLSPTRSRLPSSSPSPSPLVSSSLSVSIAFKPMTSPSLLPTSSNNFTGNVTIDSAVGTSSGSSGAGIVSAKSAGALAGISVSALVLGVLLVSLIQRRRKHRLAISRSNSGPAYPPPSGDPDLDVVINPMSFVNTRSLERRLADAETKLSNNSLPASVTAIPVESAVVKSKQLATADSPEKMKTTAAPLVPVPPPFPSPPSAEPASASELPIPATVTAIDPSKRTSVESNSTENLVPFPTSVRASWATTGTISTSNRDLLRKGSDDSEVIDSFADRSNDLHLSESTDNRDSNDSTEVNAHLC